MRATFFFSVASLMVGSQVLVRIYTNILKLCNHVLLPYAGTGGRLRGEFSLYCIRYMHSVSKWWIDKLRMLSLVLRRLLGGGPVKAIARDLVVCRSVIEREVDHVDRKEAKEGREAQASYRVEAEKEKASQKHREKRDMTGRYLL